MTNPDDDDLPEGLDATDPNQLLQWIDRHTLDPSVTEAQAAAVSRAFRRLPAAAQRPNIESSLQDYSKIRDLAARLLTKSEPGDPHRAEFESLLEQANRGFENATLRLLELDDEP